ncbi:flagellin [Candidatus Halobonum tyrrellensis]|uniref:Flagellin n=1 Tax=Candidatus Halobonum tyrrellensis G22 TaxID=1324957 RepID=V4HFQ5_9EURY|nr:flagellin [Candidatus Halobonum tyrrellensis]ESP89525.1 flagellin [Candidatus Halobonum tyrrellensis G22]
MAGASISEMILFIAALVVAASVAGTLTSEVAHVGDAISARSLDVADQVRSDVEVVSDPAVGVYNTSGDGNVTVYVRNTGSSTLPTGADGVDVLLDGRYRTDVRLTVVDGGDTWARGSVVRLDVPAPGLASGDHRLMLVVNEDEEVFRFRT